MADRRRRHPDPGTDNDATLCNVTNDGFPANDPVNTGSRSTCVSRFGAFDMVGNMTEWVADRTELADGSGACDGWPAGYGTDETCFGDATPSRFPGAVFRGGDLDEAPTAPGLFAAAAYFLPSGTGGSIGFRGAR